MQRATNGANNDSSNRPGENAHTRDRAAPLPPEDAKAPGRYLEPGIITIERDATAMASGSRLCVVIERWRGQHGKIHATTTATASHPKADSKKIVGTASAIERRDGAGWLGGPHHAALSCDGVWDGARSPFGAARDTISGHATPGGQCAQNQAETWMSVSLWQPRPARRRLNSLPLTPTALHRAEIDIPDSAQKASPNRQRSCGEKIFMGTHESEFFPTRQVGKFANGANLSQGAHKPCNANVVRGRFSAPG